MRSTECHTISGGEVHQWAVNSVVQAKLVKDHGWLCKATVVASIVLRAAARSISIPAACRDLSNAPSDQAVRNALEDGLPKTLRVLERRLNEALTCDLPKRMLRRSWDVAIDFHLSPYYGEPLQSRNELYYGQPRQGTKRFHAYATACIVSYGHRYTLALTWVRRHESTVTALRRLVARIREIGLKIRCLLLDRAFFNVPVVAFLQQEALPFLMPVMFRGRKPKKPGRRKGLWHIKRQPAGWYRHVMKNAKQQLEVKVCVGFRRYRRRKTRKQLKQKLLFAAWRVHGSPVEIRDRYRRRFGIETSYRQMRQARIYTCTRQPHLRLFFVALALILRNIWVWIHLTRLAAGERENPTMRLELLRFKRMLDWIVNEVVALLHDGSMPYVDADP
jgi:hypothetical protein